MRTFRGGALLIFAAVIALVAPACSRKPAAPPDQGPGGDMIFGQTVRGKVTYDGTSVPYGYVLFYHPAKSHDLKSGRVAAVAMSEIKDGTYEISNAPTGPVIICVATDPDVDPTLLTMPAPIGPPKIEPWPMGKGKLPPGVPPPPAFDPKIPPKVDPESTPMPPDQKLPANLKGGHPATAHLSDEKRQMLREIHRRYGKFPMSPLSYGVVAGEQTFNIEMEK
jgi:hypothetical protein